MKEVMSHEALKRLPENYVAILFEGSWLFTQDPKDPTRILAVCPYQNAPDHVCDYGLWTDERLTVFSADTDGGKIAEGEEYRVEVGPGTPPAQSFDELFEAVAKEYPIIYVKSRGTANKLGLGNTSGLRRISVSQPDEVRPAGRLLNTPIRLGSSNPARFQLGERGVVSSYVTFVFFYTRDLDAPGLRVGPVDTFASVEALSASGNPHLVFNVHSIETGVVDSCSDNLHLISTFDQMRKLIQLHGETSSTPQHCDFGMFPTSGDQHFNSGDTGLSNAELGLPQDPVTADLPTHTGLTLASCAGGIAVSHTGH